jgi:type I restriction enzyme S subunit
MYDTAALKMSITKKEISSNQAIIGLLPSTKVLSEFVYYQLLYLRPKVMLERSGVRQQNLNSTKIKAIRIKYVPLAEQKKIVTHLDALAAKIAQVQAYQKSTATNLTALEKSVLAKAFENPI